MVELIRVLILIFHIAYWLIWVLWKIIISILRGLMWLIYLLILLLSKDDKKEEADHSKPPRLSRPPSRGPKKKHTPKRRQERIGKYRINEYGEVFEA